MGYTVTNRQLHAAKYSRFGIAAVSTEEALPLVAGTLAAVVSVGRALICRRQSPQGHGHRVVPSYAVPNQKGRRRVHRQT